MTKVWILFKDYDREGKEVERVFTTSDQANEYARNLCPVGFTTHKYEDGSYSAKGKDFTGFYSWFIIEAWEVESD